MQISEIDVLASLCKASFADFVREFWDIVVPDKMIPNWHIDFICEELQTVAERVFAGKQRLYDLVINVSPGSSKSTIASIMFPAWCWTRMPHFKFIGASYAANLSMDLSRKCRDVIKSDLYQACFPNIRIREDQDTKGYFVNTKGGQRFSVGSCGSVIGMHGHCIGIDDPIDPHHALSEAEMYQINNWIIETLSSRKTNRNLTPMILIMQRLHQEDPTAQFLKRHRVRHICLPAELTSNARPEEVRDKYIDGLMDPVRLPREVLAETEQDIGPYGYSGQFLQDPVPRSGGMFDVSRLKYGVPSKLVRVIRYWDKAGTAGKTKRGRGAFTVGLEMGLDDEDRIFILDVIRVRMDSYDREKLIVETADNDGYDVRIGIEQEGGSGGKESAEGTVRRLAGYRVTLDIPHGDKETRADPFSVQVNAGNVHLVPGDWNYEYVKEMRFFPFSSTKDQIDASSGAFAMLQIKRQRVGGMKSTGSNGQPLPQRRIRFI